MAKYTPQYNAFKALIITDKVSNYLIWIVFILALVPILLTNFVNCICIDVLNAIEYLNIALLLIGFILNSVKDYYLFPKAETKRRYDFIDNSFGSNFSLSQSDEYYTNDEVEKGNYKMAVNLFQDVFFTTSISKKMRVKAIMKSGIFSLVFIVMAIYGFKNSPLALPVLQLFFSAFILGDLIKLLLFINRNEHILDHLTTVFSSGNIDHSIILKNYVQYETNLSWAMILLDDKVFKKKNDSIEKKWQKVKTKYNIK